MRILIDVLSLAGNNHHNKKVLKFINFYMGQMKNEKRLLKRLELPEWAEFRNSHEMEKSSGRNLSDLSPLLHYQ